MAGVVADVMSVAKVIKTTEVINFSKTGQGSLEIANKIDKEKLILKGFTADDLAKLLENARKTKNVVKKYLFGVYDKELINLQELDELADIYLAKNIEKLNEFKNLDGLDAFLKKDVPEWYRGLLKGLEDVVYGKNFISKLNANTTLNSIEKSIAQESHEILNSSEFKTITDGFVNKTPVQVEINGRTITYDDAPFSGMTWFEKNGFSLGREAFESNQELIKTVLHEMYRLRTSILKGSGAALEVSKETKAAFDYAEKAYYLFE